MSHNERSFCIIATHGMNFISRSFGLFCSIHTRQTFLTLSLQDMASRVQLSGPQEAEKYVLHMVSWSWR